MTTYDLSDTKTDLRPLLRQKTSQAHSKLDQDFSRPSIRSRVGYIRFLAVHHMALGYCYRTFPDDLRQMAPCPISMLEHDLASLNGTIPPAWTPRDPVIAPVLGIKYVLYGARLGAKVLLNDVRKSSDPKVVSATAFLTEQQDLTPWRRVLTELSETEAGQGDHHPLVSSANQTFDIFSQALGEWDARIDVKKVHC